MDPKKTWVVLYSHWSYTQGLYPYHIETLDDAFDTGMDFFQEPHDNAWVLVGLFLDFESATEFVSALQSIRPPKDKAQKQGAA